MPVPVFACGSKVFIEIIIRYFRRQITCCPFHAYPRNGRAHKELFSLCCLKVKTCHDRSPDSFSIFQDCCRIQPHRLKGAGKACTEKDALTARPSVRKTIALNSNGIHFLYIRIFRKVPVHGFPQIQDNGCISLGKGIALNAATLGCGKLYVDIVIFQEHAIVTCACGLIGMREPGMDAQRFFSLLIRKSYRHEGNVIQIARPCTRKMGVTETGNRTVGIKISRNAVPTGKPVVGTELHHAEGNLCTGICIPGKICTDKRIYIVCITFVCDFQSVPLHTRG